MKKSKLFTLILGFCLALQLNYCRAAEYNEELTLPVGATFDLEMDDEITGMDYDAKIINIEKINGRDVPVLKQTGDTVVTVYFKTDNGSVPMKFLIHSLTTARYDEVTDDHGEVKPEYQKLYDKKAYAANNPAPTVPAKTTDTATAKTETKPTAPATPAATAPVVQNATKPTTAPAVQAASAYPEHGSFAEQVCYLVNEERARNNVAPVTLSSDLQRCASIRAEEIISYFAHSRPDGTNYFTVLPDPDALSAENIAAGQTNAVDVVKAWLRSPGHKANILNAHYKELGVGHAFNATAAHKHYWVQLFRG